jgi:DinB superfamily
VGALPSVRGMRVRRQDGRFADVPDLIRANAAGWTDVLTRDDVAVRPSPTVWSPLEYACHVRDVFRLYDQRLHRMLGEDDPLFANWDQDETAVAERYWAHDPAVVAGELDDAAAAVAASFAAVSGAQWQRPGRRSDGAPFTRDVRPLLRPRPHPPPARRRGTTPPEVSRRRRSLRR